jgi:hypothetical protein
MRNYKRRIIIDYYLRGWDRTFGKPSLKSIKSHVRLCEKMNNLNKAQN